MSKRVILLVTYDDPEAAVCQTRHLGVCIAPTLRVALQRAKEMVKEKFAEHEKNVGFNEGEFKLGKFVRYGADLRKDQGLIGFYPIIATDSGGECEDTYEISEVESAVIT